MLGPPRDTRKCPRGDSPLHFGQAQKRHSTQPRRSHLLALHLLHSVFFYLNRATKERGRMEARRWGRIHPRSPSWTEGSLSATSLSWGRKRSLNNQKGNVPWWPRMFLRGPGGQGLTDAEPWQNAPRPSQDARTQEECEELPPYLPGRLAGARFPSAVLGSNEA